MTHYLCCQPAGGQRPYILQVFNLETEAMPTKDDAIQMAARLIPSVAGHLMRLSIYQYTFEHLVKKGGVGLEIGVDHGDQAAKCLEQAKPRVMILVDPWVSSEWDSWFSDDSTVMDQRHKNVCERFGGHGGVFVLRETSDAAFEAFKDAGTKFDWIHIDGDHRYDQVKKDLENAYSLLNWGGYIILDDYYCKRWTADIKKAADEWVSTVSVEIVQNKFDPIIYRKVENGPERLSPPTRDGDTEQAVSICP